ncbi:MAG TPA: GatB/YqeY domain-containing protein [Actinomycetota bacterium]|nr:GatB/YqeY domain-containing protein [Actinomycetota bacterium]
MGDLKDRMEREMKEALKAGEKLRLGALRMLAAAVKNREVELRHELSDEEFVEVAQRQVKKHKESAEAFTSGGREELAERERQEQAVLEAYLPAGFSDEEVAALVDEAMAATGATDPGDLGKVMGYVMGKAKGRVDGGTVNRLVRERLAG